MEDRPNGCCANCAFYHDEITNDEACIPSNHYTGECRAGPPKIAAEGDGYLIRGRGIWPAVDEGDWCGAFMPATAQE